MAVDLSDPDTYLHGVPYEAFRRLRDDEPVSRRTEPNAKTYWAVTRYADVLTVLKNPALFSSARGGSLIGDPPPPMLEKMRDGLLHKDPPDHTRMRRMVNKAFTPRRVQELEDRIEHHARELVDGIVARGRCDFAAEVAGEMPLFVICEILGVPVEDRARLHKLTERMLESPVAGVAASMQDTFLAVQEMRAYGAELGRKKREQPAGDLVSDLVNGEEEQKKMTAGEFEALFLLLFNAGSDTTKTLLCFAVDYLADHPDLWARLRADARLLPPFIEEMLRYESPVIQFRRTATRETQLGGRTIAEGDKVVLFFPSANRDERVFPDPDRFDPARSPNDHLSFGHGTHFCFGAPLARVEARHVLQQLVRRVGKIERTSPLTLGRSNFVRGVKRLELAVHPA